jgi:DNA-binding NtrC family response regulator
MASTRATVAVVQESPAVLELVEQALRDAGHRVLVTPDPLELLELARHVAIDVLVADVDTLERDERKLLRNLRSLQPQLAVVYIAPAGDGAARHEDGSIVLLGPFSLRKLEEAVAAALDPRGTP